MTLPQLPELSEALERRTLALFIGSDLPSEVTGLPSQADLARGLARRKGLEESLSLAEVAQRVSQAGNRWEFTDFIRTTLDTAGLSPATFHRRIAALVKEHQIEILITTTFDNLLELAFQEAGVRFNRVVRGADVSFINPDRPTLFKLYGDAQQPDTLVVTDRDHLDLLRDRDKEELLAEVQRAFRRNTMLFLGYNLADPDFRFTFDRIAESRFARAAYAVWPGLPEVDVKMWGDRGIKILDIDPFGLLVALSAAPQRLGAPPATSPLASGELDLDRGLEALREYLAGADDGTKAELGTLADRLAYNRRQERLFGSTESIRNERSQIVFSLNELALRHCGVSFNELCQGAEPRPLTHLLPATRQISQPDPTTMPSEAQPRELEPPRRERAWVRFKLQIDRLTNRAFEVRALQTPMGEPQSSAQLPYGASQLIAILKVLESGGYDSGRFSSKQSEVLQELGLLRQARLVPDLHSRIGRGLYHALFPAQVGTAFQLALAEARTERATVALQLRLDQDAVALARYPWELMHDEHRHLLSGGLVELARYITYPEATATLPVAPPWRLLYISARPEGDLEPLPEDMERRAVWNALEALGETRMLKLEQLDPPTYNALLDRMAVTDFHIIHFDGHGVFARRCPQCGTLHHPHVTPCRTCATPLDEVPPQGYLAFEDRSGCADFVSTEAMENLLLGSEVRLVLLSSCQSAVVQGDSLFGGLGPGLIRAGVPAVVAMQFSVSVEAAVNFAQGFYGALAQGETVPRAVAQGRRRLFRDKAWFIPTLYLRSTDDEGRLFTEELGQST